MEKPNRQKKMKIAQYNRVVDWQVLIVLTLNRAKGSWCLVEQCLRNSKWLHYFLLDHPFVISVDQLESLGTIGFVFI